MNKQAARAVAGRNGARQASPYGNLLVVRRCGAVDSQRYVSGKASDDTTAAQPHDRMTLGRSTICVQSTLSVYSVRISPSDRSYRPPRRCSVRRHRRPHHSQGRPARPELSAIALTVISRTRDALLNALMEDGLAAWEKIVRGIRARDSLEWLEALGEAYLDFALTQPHRFDAAFSCPRPRPAGFPMTLPQAGRP